VVGHDDASRPLDAERDGGTGRRRAGLAELDAVVARAEEAGLRVEVERRGDLAALGGVEDLVAFRIVQESVTNALRHALPGAAMIIRLERSGDLLTITATDDGGRATDPDASSPSGRSGPGGSSPGGRSGPGASSPSGRSGPGGSSPGGRSGPGASSASGQSGAGASSISGRSDPGSVGHGLVGMRERVALHGGRFEAGPVHGGGWRVVATLPLEAGLPAGARP
ncbi:ATP-binding protein, partial [Dactylosporangium sp. NPDC051485]|uniref:sensor histidine kinase n=1 Tax=Dactylosporangium sp. NPDC051485 TaxID=3154846 RepID=UPI00342FB7DE